MEDLNLRANSLEKYHLLLVFTEERIHRSLKTATVARKEYWLLSLPIILFSLHCIPNDSEYSSFQAVT